MVKHKNLYETKLVDSREAGSGNMGVSIRAAGNPVKHSLKSISEGLYEITFYPTISVPHKIDVKYNGLHIRGAYQKTSSKKSNLKQIKNRTLRTNKTLPEVCRLSFGIANKESCCRTRCYGYWSRTVRSKSRQIYFLCN